MSFGFELTKVYIKSDFCRFISAVVRQNCAKQMWPAPKDINFFVNFNSDQLCP